MMEDRKLIQEKLIREVGLELQPLAFIPRISHQAFYKKTTFGKYSFHLTFIPHATDIDVTADVAIRFDALENLFQGTSRAGSRTNTFTFGANLGHIRGNGQIR